MTELYLDNSSVSPYTFGSIEALQRVETASTNTKYISVDGLVYNKDYTKLVFVPSGRKSIIIPDPVTDFEDLCFGDAETNQLQSITFGANSVYSIQLNKVYGLLEINVPDTNSKYASFDGALYDKKLTKLIFCPLGKKSLKFPDSVTSAEANGILNYVYNEYNHIQNITLGKSTPWLKEMNKLSELTEINVSPESEMYKSVDGVLYNKDATELIKCPAMKETVNIPASVKTIQKGAFDGCSIKKITFADKMEEIPDNAFTDIKTLETVVFGKSIKTIGSNAFKGCKGLTEITLPDSLKTINHSAFEGCSGIQTVNFGKSLEIIGSRAFCSCSGLTEITLPDSLKEIGESGFEDCYNIKTINFGKSIKTLGKGAFYKCRALTDVTVPNTVTFMGSSCFKECSRLESIHIPDSVTELSGYVFESCGALKNVELPGTLKSIGEYSFSGCRGLENITIPEGVTKIDKNAFAECESLQSIMLPDSVTEIGQAAFWSCVSLKKVDYPASEKMTVIPKWCFERCTALETIPMTKYIKTIEDGAFNDCNLKELVIPDNVESAVMPFSYQEYYYPDTNEAKRKKQIPEQDRVLERVYIGKNINNIIVSNIICPKFTEFEVSPENQTYTSINGILYTKDGKSIISIPSGIPEVIIPEGAESFADKAALSTTYSQKMSIPASFEDMDFEAFKKFPELTQLELSPDNPVYSTDGKAILSKDKTELIYVLPSIKDYTVPDYIKKLSENSCKTVERLIIPEGITEIPAGVIWYDTKMISIPNSVTKIDEAILKSFNDRIKSNQTVALDVYCDYDSPAMAIFKSIITVSRYYTDGKTHHQIWYKPRGGENYDLDFVFGDDGEINVNGYHGSDTSITIPGSLNGKQVVGIDSNTFSGNKNIVSVTIEDGVDWIGQNVFLNCSSLSSVRLPNTLTLIGFGAFAGCGSLRCLTLPKSLKSIDGERVFKWRNSRF